MAFDGITVAAVAAELKKDLLNSRIYKIAQPESDELIITLKTTDGGQKRLLLSADASLPLTYFTEQTKPDDCPELYQPFAQAFTKWQDYRNHPAGLRTYY